MDEKWDVWYSVQQHQPSLQQCSSRSAFTGIYFLSWKENICYEVGKFFSSDFSFPLTKPTSFSADEHTCMHLSCGRCFSFTCWLCYFINIYTGKELVAGAVCWSFILAIFFISPESLYYFTTIVCMCAYVCVSAFVKVCWKESLCKLTPDSFIRCHWRCCFLS